MRTIVATASSKEEADQVYASICSSHFAIVWMDISTRHQVTVIVETEKEFITRIEEQFPKQEEVEPIKKQRKSPTVRDLNAKAEKLCLFNLAVQKNQGRYEVVNNYGKNELLYSCATTVGISRYLTRVQNEKMIAHLQSEGLLPTLN